MPINRADRPGLPDDPSASGGGQTGRHSAADWSGEFSARNPAQRPPSGTGKMPGVPQRGPVSSLPPTPPGFGLPGFDRPEQPRPGTPGASGSFGWPYPEE